MRHPRHIRRDRLWPWWIAANTTAAALGYGTWLLIRP